MYNFSQALYVVPHAVFQISGLSLQVGDVDVLLAIQIKLFAVRHHYPVNPSTDRFHTDAVVSFRGRPYLSTLSKAYTE